MLTCASGVVTGAIAPGLVVTISQPTRDHVVGDTLSVFATAASANRITGAVAAVGTHQISLTRGTNVGGVIEKWTGDMLLVVPVRIP